MKQLKDYIPSSPDVRTYMSGSVFSNEALVGIEVELEKFEPTLAVGDLKYWRAEGDGSLREGGIEYVLQQPLTGYDLEMAVQELKEKVLTCKYVTNQRCSTHVHIDARDMSVNHLQAMVFIYCMVERLIYDLVAPEREDSFYCTPLYKSTLHRRIVSKALQSLQFDHCPKYSGLNLKTLRKYGSLEFRMHEGLDPNTDIIKWIQVLMRLKSGTHQYEDTGLKDILRAYSENSAEHIIREVFRELADDILPSNVINLKDRLKDSMRSAQDILLLQHDASLQKIENEWLRELRGNSGDIPGIDPEILEALRQRRNEILAEQR